MKFYLFGMCAVAIFASYWCGRRVGHLQCVSDVANVAQQNQSAIIKQQEFINAQVNHTAVHDIRRILHDKYTIAE